MPGPQKESLYVTWQFTINTTDEVAQVGLHMTDPVQTMDPVAVLAQTTTGQLQALDTAMSKLLAIPAISFNENVRYNGLKVAPLGTDGAYLADPKVYVRGTPLTPTSTNANILLQASICLSWRAATALGAGTRGRMYLPATGPNSWSSGSVHMPSGLMPAMATGAATFIKDCNVTWNTLAEHAPVACIVYKNPEGTVLPLVNRIVSVRVGDMVDTQRRRRAQVAENYFSAAVP